MKFFKQQFQNLKWSLGRIFSAKKRQERKAFQLTIKTRHALTHKIANTGISASRIDEILSDTNNHYRRYYIPKADGSKREICEPSSELRRLQKAVLTTIKTPKVSGFCTAYETGSSVKKNAQKHQNAAHVLHIDIKDFFPSITKKMFMDIYKPLVCYHFYCKNWETCEKCAAAKNLWRIVSLNGGLPIGASTSPFIGNRVMATADIELASLDKSLTYTRYADDMVFSSKKPISADFIQKVEAIINKHGFEINHKKTYFMKSRKQVTGVLLIDGKLSVGTAYKKRLKKEIYNYLTKGTGKPQTIKGKFTWLSHIEPEYAKTIKSKYLPLDNKGFWD